MKKESPFTEIPFDDFNVEQQTFQQGIRDDDFHISVPNGNKMDAIRFENGGLLRERIALDQYGVITTYATATARQGFYLFSGRGAAYFNLNGSQNKWRTILHAANHPNSDYSLDGATEPFSDGTAVAFLNYTDSDGENDIDNIELVQFHPEDEKMEILASFPRVSNKEWLVRWNLPNGFLLSRRRYSEITEDARYFGFDGKLNSHPLADGINALRHENINIQFNLFFPSQSKDPWGIFYCDSLSSFPSNRLHLLSVSDTIQATPIVAERNSLEMRKSLDFVMVHPNLNLFLLGVKQDDHILLYLGRVKKTNNAYSATTYRLRPFPEVASPIFSRNGQVLLFAARTAGRNHLVFAKLPDLLADVNRRYPEAKLDLDALKAEVQ
ncbi:MAG: hypothetical protein H6686_02915 [Fibrobacteria bacterium]|nr:hypothetical protein [Fibrobacteria bacterium]